MPETIEKLNQILFRYANGPILLQSAIQGLNEQQLDLCLSAGSWSIRQNIHHVADGDYLWKGFILQAAADPGCEFSLAWYWNIPQDEWANRWSYAGRDISQSLALLEANRHHTVELLNTTPGLWDKSLLIHWSSDEVESVTVAEVIEMQARHVEGHVDEIRTIRQVIGI